MIVVRAGRDRRERAGITALAGREKSHLHDLRTLRMRRIDAADDIVRAHIVVDERHFLPDRDRDVER